MTQIRINSNAYDPTDENLKKFLHPDARAADFSDGRLLSKEQIQEINEKLTAAGEVGDARYSKKYLKETLGINIDRGGVMRVDGKLYAVYKDQREEKGCSIFKEASLPDEEELQLYKNKYILVNKQLYFVNAYAEAKPVTIEDTDKFMREYAKLSLSGVNSEIHLTHNQANDLIKSNGGHSYQRAIAMGMGNYGKVKLIQDLETGEFKALKILHNYTGDAAQQFQVEAENLRLLGQGVGGVIVKKKANSEGMGPDKLCIIQDLAPGKELFDVLKDKDLQSITERCDVVLKMFEAVAAFHAKGFLHRDLKPENVRYDRESGILSLVDMGLIIKKDAHNLNERFCGTPGYMSDEVLDSKAYSEKSDIYALARIVQEVFGVKETILLSNGWGEHTYGLLGEDAQNQLDALDPLKNGIHPKIEALINKMKESNPSDRGSLADAIKEIKEIKETYTPEGINEKKAREQAARIQEEQAALVLAEQAKQQALSQAAIVLPSSPWSVASISVEQKDDNPSLVSKMNLELINVSEAEKEGAIRKITEEAQRCGFSPLEVREIVSGTLRFEFNSIDGVKKGNLEWLGLADIAGLNNAKMQKAIQDEEVRRSPAPSRLGVIASPPKGVLSVKKMEAGSPGTNTLILSLDNGLMLPSAFSTLKDKIEAVLGMKTKAYALPLQPGGKLEKIEIQFTSPENFKSGLSKLQKLEGTLNGITAAKIAYDSAQVEVAKQEREQAKAKLKELNIYGVYEAADGKSLTVVVSSDKKHPVDEVQVIADLNKVLGAGASNWRLQGQVAPEGQHFFVFNIPITSKNKINKLGDLWIDPKRIRSIPKSSGIVAKNIERMKDDKSQSLLLSLENPVPFYGKDFITALGLFRDSKLNNFQVDLDYDVSKRSLVTGIRLSPRSGSFSPADIAALSAVSKEMEGAFKNYTAQLTVFNKNEAMVAAKDWAAKMSGKLVKSNDGSYYLTMTVGCDNDAALAKERSELLQKIFHDSVDIKNQLPTGSTVTSSDFSFEIKLGSEATYSSSSYLKDLIKICGADRIAMPLPVQGPIELSSFYCTVPLKDPIVNSEVMKAALDALRGKLPGCTVNFRGTTEKETGIYIGYPETDKNGVATLAALEKLNEQLPDISLQLGLAKAKAALDWNKFPAIKNKNDLTVAIPYDDKLGTNNEIEKKKNLQIIFGNAIDLQTTTRDGQPVIEFRVEARSKLVAELGISTIKEPSVMPLNIKNLSLLSTDKKDKCCLRAEVNADLSAVKQGDAGLEATKAALKLENFNTQWFYNSAKQLTSLDFILKSGKSIAAGLAELEKLQGTIPSQPAVSLPGIKDAIAAFRELQAKEVKGWSASQEVTAKLNKDVMSYDDCYLTISVLCDPGDRVNKENQLRVVIGETFKDKPQLKTIDGKDYLECNIKLGDAAHYQAKLDEILSKLAVRPLADPASLFVTGAEWVGATGGPSVVKLAVSHIIVEKEWLLATEASLRKALENSCGPNVSFKCIKDPKDKDKITGIEVTLPSGKKLDDLLNTAAPFLNLKGHLTTLKQTDEALAKQKKKDEAYAAAKTAAMSWKEVSAVSTKKGTRHFEDYYLEVTVPKVGDEAETKKHLSALYGKAETEFQSAPGGALKFTLKYEDQKQYEKALKDMLTQFPLNFNFRDDTQKIAKRPPIQKKPGDAEQNFLVEELLKDFKEGKATIKFKAGAECGPDTISAITEALGAGCRIDAWRKDADQKVIGFDLASVTSAKDDAAKSAGELYAGLVNLAGMGDRLKGLSSLVFPGLKEAEEAAAKWKIGVNDAVVNSTGIVSKDYQVKLRIPCDLSAQDELRSQLLALRGVLPNTSDPIFSKTPKPAMEVTVALGTEKEYVANLTALKNLMKNSALELETASSHYFNSNPKEKAKIYPSAAPARKPSVVPAKPPAPDVSPDADLAAQGASVLSLKIRSGNSSHSSKIHKRTVLPPAPTQWHAVKDKAGNGVQCQFLGKSVDKEAALQSLRDRLVKPAAGLNSAVLPATKEVQAYSCQPIKENEVRLKIFEAQPIDFKGAKEPEHTFDRCGVAVSFPKQGQATQLDFVWDPAVKMTASTKDANFNRMVFDYGPRAIQEEIANQGANSPGRMAVVTIESYDPKDKMTPAELAIVQYCYLQGNLGCEDSQGNRLNLEKILSTHGLVTKKDGRYSQVFKNVTEVRPDAAPLDEQRDNTNVDRDTQQIKLGGS